MQALGSAISVARHGDSGYNLLAQPSPTTMPVGGCSRCAGAASRKWRCLPRELPKFS